MTPLPALGGGVSGCSRGVGAASAASRVLVHTCRGAERRVYTRGSSALRSPLGAREEDTMVGGEQEKPRTPPAQVWGHRTGGCARGGEGAAHSPGGGFVPSSWPGSAQTRSSDLLPKRYPAAAPFPKATAFRRAASGCAPPLAPLYPSPPPGPGGSHPASCPQRTPRAAAALMLGSSVLGPLCYLGVFPSSAGALGGSDPTSRLGSGSRSPSPARPAPATALPGIALPDALGPACRRMFLQNLRV